MDLTVEEPEPRVASLDDDEGAPIVSLYPGHRTRVRAELDRYSTGEPFGTLRVGAVGIRITDPGTASRIRQALGELIRHFADEVMVEDGPEARAS